MNFFDFLKKKKRDLTQAQENDLPLLQVEVAKKTNNALAIAAPPGQASKKTDILEFSENLGRLAVGDDFIRELSDAIQRPRRGESEDEFVKRCKKSLFALIDKKLSK